MRPSLLLCAALLAGGTADSLADSPAGSSALSRGESGRLGLELSSGGSLRITGLLRREGLAAGLGVESEGDGGFLVPGFELIDGEGPRLALGPLELGGLSLFLRDPLSVELPARGGGSPGLDAELESSLRGAALGLGGLGIFALEAAGASLRFRSGAGLESTGRPEGLGFGGMISRRLPGLELSLLAALAAFPGGPATSGWFDAPSGESAVARILAFELSGRGSVSYEAAGAWNYSPQGGGGGAMRILGRGRIEVLTWEAGLCFRTPTFRGLASEEGPELGRAKLGLSLEVGRLGKLGLEGEVRASAPLPWLQPRFERSLGAFLRRQGGEDGPGFSLALGIAGDSDEERAELAATLGLAPRPWGLSLELGGELSREAWPGAWPLGGGDFAGGYAGGWGLAASAALGLELELPFLRLSLASELGIESAFEDFAWDLEPLRAGLGAGLELGRGGDWSLKGRLSVEARIEAGTAPSLRPGPFEIGLSLSWGRA